MLHEIGFDVTLDNAHSLLLNEQDMDEALQALADGYPSERRRALQEHFTQRYRNQPPEQMGGVRETIANYLQYFLTPDIAEVFCAGESTFEFSDVDRGKIVCVAMPQKCQTERRYVNTFLKMLFYTHVLRRFDKPKAEREHNNLLILWADEAQRFVTDSEDGIWRLELGCQLSENRLHMSDNSFQMKVANPIDKAMLARIKARGDDWVFSAADFLDLGSRDAVDKALSRMAAAKTTRRVARGLYDVPRQHPIAGTLLPSVDKVARALAGKAGTRLQPTGAYAANLLGLSDQVPAKVVFLTDGRRKRVRLGNLNIVFKQTSPRSMATAGKISGLVIHALRYLGKNHVNDDTVKRLDRRLSADDRKQLLKDLAYAPAWIGVIIWRLAAKA